MGCIPSSPAAANVDPLVNNTQTGKTAEMDPAATRLDPNNQTEKSPFFPLSPTLTNLLGNGTKASKDWIGEGAHHLKNVFAIPLSTFGSMGLPRHSKPPEEIQFMEKHLRQNYLFESLPHNDMVALIAAFEKFEITESEVAEDPEKGVVIKENEIVNHDTAYFYLLYQGNCSYMIGGATVGIAKPGDSFGELALLYDCPRAATVMALFSNENKATGNATSSLTSTTATFTPSDTAITVDNIKGNSVVLFRVHQTSFRRILQECDQADDDAKLKLLSSVSFLKDVGHVQKTKLAAAMKPFQFKKGEYLLRKGDRNCSFQLIQRGSVRATNIGEVEDEVSTESESKSFYNDMILKEGNTFGERSIMTGKAAAADVIAESDGLVFIIDRESFHEVVGDLKDIILRSLDLIKLQGIEIITNTTQNDERMLAFLATKIVDKKFKAGEILCEEGRPLFSDPALFLVRRGEIEISSKSSEAVIIGMDDYFGDDQLLGDVNIRKKFVSRYTAKVVSDCVCGVLYLESCRRIVDTHRMGQAQNIKEMESLRVGGNIVVSLKDLKLHCILGAGTFGQVWLVSRESSNKKTSTYALKVQSKYELCESGQANGVVREKNIMSQFHNPFVAGLVASFQDEKCVYMVMNLIQGGELHSVMHSEHSDVLTENDARFYAACISEGLGYMHRMGFVYRDLKPENVLIDNDGYAVIIDFGFCKRIVSKTYTMCGTPLYLPPEIILNRGHGFAADHWSLGILLFEMLVGETPFYSSGMTKSDLFQAIVKDKIPPPANVSKQALSLISSLLKRDPSKRIGSQAGGETDIIEHPWFRMNGFDVDMLFLRQIKAPMVPRIKNPLDDGNFRDWSHVDNKLTTQYPKLNAQQAKIFDDF